MNRQNPVIQFWRHFTTSWISIIALVIVSLPVLPQSEARASSSCNTSDPEVKARKDSCLNGQTWNSEKCSCETSAGSEHLRKLIMECQEIEDPGERRTCQENLAKNTSLQQETDDWANVMGHGMFQSVASSIAAISVGATIAAMVSANDNQSRGGSDACYCRWFMGITSVAVVAAEIFTYFFLNNELKDLRKKYQEEFACTKSSEDEEYTEGCLNSSQDSYEAQMQAFVFLRDEQLAIAKIALVKSIIYGIATAAYLATTIAAIVEIAQMAASTGASPCTAQIGELELKYSYSYLPLGLQKNLIRLERKQNIARLIKAFLLPEVRAEDAKVTDDQLVNTNTNPNSENARDDNPDNDNLLSSDDSGWGGDWKYFEMYQVLMTGGIAAGIGIIASLSSGFKAFLRSPITILVMAIILTAMYSMLMAASIHQHILATDNASKAESVRLRMEGIEGTFCSKGREDVSDPKCYCFLDGGKRNPNRENSQTCQALFARLDGFAPPEPEPDNQFGDKNIIGCMTINRQFDQECQCKKFKDKKTGQNACFQVPMASTQLGSLGNNLGINDTLKDLNALTNGSLPNSLAGGELKNRVKRMGDASKQLLKKANDVLGKNGKKPVPLPDSKAIDRLVAQTVPKEDLSRLNAQTGEVGTLASNNPALQKAMDEIKKANKTTLTGGTGWGKKAEEKKSNDFDFSLEDKGAAGATTGELGFMDKKYNFKDNDIVKNGDANIWQIITNRYNQSGYLRLFDE